MRNYKTVLSLDPSGSFFEGKGTTGWCEFNAELMNITNIGCIHAVDFEEMEEYWDKHIQLIKEIRNDYYPERVMIVIEDYLVYGDKAESQTNSRMETPKLIGVLQHYCWRFKNNYWMQLAHEVKNRWSDSILVHKGYLIYEKNRYYVDIDGQLVQTNQHMRDALRHAVHYATFKNGGN